MRCAVVNNSINPSYTCLVYLTNSGITSIPHQIGLQRLYPGNTSSIPIISEPEVVLEMHGHIVGIAQDREGRYLYVNVRRWPEGAVPTDDDPPPIDSWIEMRVVDLRDLTVKEQVYRGHRGYTDSEGAFYIYLSISDRLVCSGSEDGAAMVWDKYYGCKIATNKHDKVVNCVALSPRDLDIMVSVSDDHKVKVWMSKSRSRSRQNRKRNNYVEESYSNLVEDLPDPKCTDSVDQGCRKNQKFKISSKTRDHA